MELTKKEAMGIIYERLPRFPTKSRKLILGIIIVSVVVIAIGLIGILTNNAYASYEIPANGILIDKTDGMYFNGEKVSPTFTGDVYYCLLVFGAFIYFIVAVYIFNFPSQTHKESLDQWEKDGTLPSIPPQRKGVPIPLLKKQ